MKRILLSAFALVLTMGLAIADADAKRLGGGKSTGMQRNTLSQPASPAPSRAVAAPTQNAAGAAGAAKKNSWLGPVAGLAAGLGLAALASHLGMGEEFANLMMIALLAVGALMLFRLFMRKRSPAPAMQYAGAGAGGGAVNLPNGPMNLEGEPAPAASASHAALPADFDAEGFARQAKLNFLRLQAANDAGNLDDLREFTSPEMFAEIQLQLGERGAATQRTEVMELNAEVLACAEEGQQHVVSVRFHGLIRESADAAPENFDEIWHLVKPIDGSRGWRVHGIQQTH